MTLALRRLRSSTVAMVLAAATFSLTAPAAVAVDSVPTEESGITVQTNAPHWRLLVDCAASDGDDYVLMAPASDTLHVTTANCPSIEVSQIVHDGRTGVAFITPDGQDPISPQDFAFDPVPTSFDVSAGTKLDFYTDDGYEFALSLSFNSLATAPDPHGTLLTIATLSLPAVGRSVVDLVYKDEYFDDETSRYLLGGVDSCDIDPGPHYYATQTLEVARAGKYTLRLSQTTPTSSTVSFLNRSGTLTDPYLAIYSTFDAEDANAGLLICSDDALLAGPYFDAYTSTSGQVLSARYPQITTELQPGEYTMVVTSYDMLQDSPASYSGAESADVEVWGPAGGILGAVMQPAATNLPAEKPSASWTDSWLPVAGTALLALLAIAGAAAIIVRRRTAATK